MPFLNVDDNFADHPKIDALSDGAFRLHVAGLCYASKHKTDGFIPDHRVSRLIRTYKPRLLVELHQARVWLPAAGGHSIHDFLDWNRSREQIEADAERLRRVRSEAGKKGAKARWQSA